MARIASDVITAHLATCNRCQALLEELERDADPVVTELRDSIRHSPINEAEITRLASRVESVLRDQGIAPHESTSRPPDEGPVKNDLEVRIQCPFCHEVSGFIDEGSESTTICPQCYERFGLVLHASDIAEHRSGYRIAKYILLEQLGAGSSGTVWKAEDTVLQRFVALKLPRRGQVQGKNMEVFLREARMAAQVRHPGIVHVYEVGVEKDAAYIASELIEGASLDVTLTQYRYGPGEAARICLAITEAVEAAHANGLVHRDLKPANILLDRQGGLHITDFGLAKHLAVDVVVTAEGRILGTPAYMSPEQASGKGTEVDQRSDLYSIGVILYELIVGRPPFSGDMHVLVSKILMEDPAPLRTLNRAVPRDLETICLKCLEKSPSRRYLSAGALATDLRLHLEGRPITARPISRLGRLWRWAMRRPALASLSVLSLLLVLVTIVALVAGHWQTISALHVAEKNLNFYRIASAQQKWFANDPRGAEEILDQCPPELRDFEWGHLKHLARTPVRRLPNAGGALAVDPVGNRLATAGGSEVTVKIWSLESDRRIWRMLGHKDFPQTFAWHPDGSIVASAGREDHTVRLWDLSRGKVIRVLEGFAYPVERCAFTPNGKQIVTHERDNHIRVWDVASGQQVHAIQLHLQRVRDLVFSPTAHRLAVASRRGDQSELAIYDYMTGDDVARIPAFKATIGSLDYSLDGSRLAVGEVRRSVRIWQVEPSLALLATITGPVGEKCRVSFDVTGKRVAAETLAGTICMWDIERGATLATFRGYSRPVYDIDFSPDGNHLIAGTGKNTVCIWDVRAEQGSNVYSGGNGSVHEITVSPDGTLLAAGFAKGMVLVWHRANGEILHNLPGNGQAIWSVEFSPDGQRLAAAGEDRSVRIYDVTSGDLQLHFTAHTRPLRCITFSPNGQLAASAGLDGQVLVWNAQTGQVHHSFEMRGSSVRTVAFHPDGRRLACGGACPDVSVLDAISGQEIWTQHWDLPIRVWDLSYSPDGKLLAVARGDGVVRLRDAEDGTLVRQFGLLADDFPIALAFLPGGQRLATATARNAVSIWDTMTGREALSISRHPFTAAAVATLPDGQGVITGTGRGFLQLWPTADYQATVTDSH